MAFFGHLTLYRSVNAFGLRVHALTKFSVQIEDDLLHPNPALEKRKHKLKRLVQSPNSYFMDVKCPGCFNM
jgi:hypothetical protein